MNAVKSYKTSSMISLFEVVDYSHEVLTDVLKSMLQDRYNLCIGPAGTALGKNASKVVRVLVGKGAHVHLLHEVRLPRPLTADVPDANASWFAQTLRQPL